MSGISKYLRGEFGLGHRHGTRRAWKSRRAERPLGDRREWPAHQQEHPRHCWRPCATHASPRRCGLCKGPPRRSWWPPNPPHAERASPGASSSFGGVGQASRTRAEPRELASSSRALPRRCQGSHAAGAVANLSTPRSGWRGQAALVTTELHHAASQGQQVRQETGAGWCWQKHAASAASTTKLRRAA